MNVKCFDCGKPFNPEECADEGYETICTCPHCKAKNYVRK
jgi:DNA-directed RNA polymerase subunit RPC12/RpoP